MERRSPGEVAAAVEADGWHVVGDAVHARFATGSFAAGIDLAVRIGAAADQANHHPDLTVTYPAVQVRITTHDAGGLTDLDIDLARAISAIARDLGVPVSPDDGPGS